MASSLSDILTALQQGVTALNNLGIQVKGSFTSISSRFTGYESAWTAYTPTLGTLAGSFTTASASGRYQTIGKTVFVYVEISITAVGTATYPIISLPVVPLNAITTVLYGSEQILTGKAVNGRFAGGSGILVTYYDDTAPSANGTLFLLAGVYEAA